MATAPPPNHDPSLSHGAPSGQHPPPPGGQPPAGVAGEAPVMPMSGLGSEQVMALLKQLPGINFPRGDLKDSAAAEALSNLAQAAYPGHPQHPGHLPHPHQPPPPYHVVHPSQHQQVMGGEPGPSTHPRGPPNLGQLANTALQNAPPPGQQPTMRVSQEPAPLSAGGANGGLLDDDQDETDKSGSTGKPASARRGGRNATMTNEEWTRQRKDNHKEVERRRRGNINEGINELGRIVPNGSGEKAKGAILSRAVQYIHHLKENEARNIEKWTLEKLLMDQAMGDLQAQLEEMRRMWEEERIARERIQSELEVLRGLQQGLSLGAAQAAAAAAVANTATTSISAPRPAGENRAKTPDASKENGGNKREREEGEAQEGASAEHNGESDPKKARME
ncbi:uncharacterized protein C8Q71DRAFT_143685 [Rhodofomes roseus]|uniref:BHLH domain-containing protein n=1 Tax=Rhodofomes roseus TaxID=34475 RepID=A0A4Y9YNG2_9APHY|nr:uncharacterized protein C8Q71DRAFT_143685 [Rhodofomes roseus]KAH9834475.1 hypothetical protein C8Q71DRAFT_143685 [Rhodofomes roseus]TFY62529.1 hypothetical protein EVJ58_g3797 [Rhodofomes roseus]